MTLAADDVMARARRAIGKGCVYVLGAGGMKADAEYPWRRADKGCDCSGFVAWCLAVSRKTDHPYYASLNGGWLETTAIVRDATTAGFGMFDQRQWNLAQIGDLLVYGDARGRQGHVGIVSGLALDGSGPSKAIHCSKGNQRRYGDAIQETSIELWLGRGIVARYAGAAV